MMPNQEALFTQINRSIVVNRAQIALSKEFIMKEAAKAEPISANGLLHQFLVSVNAVSPKEIVIHSSIDSSISIQLIIKNISWSLAFSEAIWSLVHNGLLLLLDKIVVEEVPRIAWTTVVPGRGGSSSSWIFPKWRYSLPDHLTLAKSQLNNNDFLTDPDLYLQKLGIDNINADVEEALKDAISCFRAELYTPCLAMLTKAVEGAWLELGLALLKLLNEDQRQKLKKQFEILSSDFSSIAKIIRTVLELYEKQDLFAEISRKSRIKLEDLRNAVIWADCVRESRNVVHYRIESTLPNDFEKVATLLMGAPAHFKLLYRLMATASEWQVIP